MCSIPNFSSQPINMTLNLRHALSFWYHLPSLLGQGVFNDSVPPPPPPPFSSSRPPLPNLEDLYYCNRHNMEDYDVRSAASILASVKEQEARFEQLTRALEEERRNVTLQLERANMPPNSATSQPLAWQQMVLQVNDANMFAVLRYLVSASLIPFQNWILLPSPSISTSSVHVWTWSLLCIIGRDTHSPCLYSLSSVPCNLICPMVIHF